MRKLTISEIQAVELDNLQIIDRICQEQDLTYYLAYGTLLGAVRNQDFIPWDDDTDIWMPRRDYEAFIAYCEKDLPAPYRIATRENSPGYPYSLARFSNQDYEFVSTKPAEQFSAGIFTDIYPLDENGSSYPVARQLYRRCKLVNMAYYAYAATWPQNFLTKSAHQLYKKAVDRIWGESFAQAVDEKIQRIIFAKTKEGRQKVGVPAWPDGGVHMLEKKHFGEGKYVPFAGSSFRVPADPAPILREYYGDYEKLPPAADRYPHHDYKIYPK